MIINNDLPEKNSGVSLNKLKPIEPLLLAEMFHTEHNILLMPSSLSNREDFDRLAQASLHSILNIFKFISNKKCFINGSSIF